MNSVESNRRSYRNNLSPKVEPKTLKHTLRLARCPSRKDKKEEEFSVLALSIVFFLVFWDLPTQIAQMGPTVWAAPSIARKTVKMASVTAWMETVCRPVVSQGLWASFAPRVSGVTYLSLWRDTWWDHSGRINGVTYLSLWKGKWCNLLVTL
ncbi:hypothetical protein PoB_004193900 [Plakobranchus ocellatus]|uniref:Uncharacterized protein n=1 Tax=Plakobranchus ocellatus TaxID=259542 RepID=A0AAV4BAN0_9GAST|nr:hypothetical protein PoB_004193900 [Plakobranchus ocellatus]